MFPKFITELEELIARSDTSESRFLLGITGPPASGKSTLARRVVEHLNAKFGIIMAQHAPMDGFHLSNEILETRGLTSVKGSPNTFDSLAFVCVLKALKSNPHRKFSLPLYDRSLHAPRPDALIVEGCHTVVVVEGNYLLLDEPPWDRIPKLLNLTWHLDIKQNLARRRLITRHINGGKSFAEAVLKVDSVDLHNLSIVDRFKNRAGRVVSQDEITQFAG